MNKEDNTLVRELSEALDKIDSLEKKLEKQDELLAQASKAFLEIQLNKIHRNIFGRKETSGNGAKLARTAAELPSEVQDVLGHIMEDIGDDAEISVYKIPINKECECDDCTCQDDE